MVFTSAARCVAYLLAAVSGRAGTPSHAAARQRDASGAVAGALRRAFALTAAALLCAACTMPKHLDADAPPPDPFNPAATQLLDDTSWELTGWTQAGGAARTVPHGDSGQPLTLTLSTANGERLASGYSGCNRFTGTYQLRDGKLSFGPLAGTRMACAGAGGQLESAYLDALAHVEKSGVQMQPPQQLQLIVANGDTLTFARHTQ
ncbi:MAG TPA: META domain-containing protein [Paraburkholderia sp.]|nr:META domain-containing protein [Paraburkholderia sp.]